MATYMINCGDYQDLSLIEIGNQKCTPLYSFGPFMRNEYIFHYVLSGKGYVSSQDKEQADTLSTPPPKILHIHYVTQICIQT